MTTLNYGTLTFSTTTPEEAAILGRALLADTGPTPDRTTPLTGTATPASRPRSHKSYAQQRARLGLPRHNRVFDALSRAPSGVYSASALAAAMAVTPTALPPLFAHARRFAKQIAPDQPFDTLVVSNRRAGPETLFLLTEAGRALTRPNGLTTP